MSLNRLKQAAASLGISEQIPNKPTLAMIRSLIVHKKKELVEKFPPGTFVELDEQLHLIKRYDVAGNDLVPDRVFTHAYLGPTQRIPKVSDLARANHVEITDAVELQEAQFWQQRHEFSGSAQRLLEDLARKNERLMIDVRSIPRMADDFLTTYWPLRTSPMITEVTADIVEDFARRWMKQKEDEKKDQER